MPWFQQELERVTGETWTARFRITDLVVTCNHGMRMFVPYPNGLGKPFLSRDAERHFVGALLVRHAQDYLR